MKFLILSLLLASSLLAYAQNEELCPLLHNKLVKHINDYHHHYETKDFSTAFLDIHIFYQFLKPIEVMCEVNTHDDFLISMAQENTCQKNLEALANLAYNIKQHPMVLAEQGADFVATVKALVKNCTPLDFVGGVKQQQQQQQVENLDRPEGATKCIVCSIGLTIYQNYMDFHHPESELASEEGKLNFCANFPSEFTRTCEQFIDLAQPHLKNKVHANSDQVCRTIGLCAGEWSICNLHGKANPNAQFEKVLNRNFFTENSLKIEAIAKQKNNQAEVEGPMDWIQKLIDYVAEKTFSRHMPLLDFDDDGFSDYPTFRGSDWRGHDCNDANKEVYPGRKTWKGEPGYDYNCNGVKGIEETTKKPWKQILCDGIKQTGIIVVGDSAGAHFSVPEDWLNVTEWNGTNFHNLYHAVSNELDWPMKSASTGFSNDTWVESTYKILVGRNRCNRNDFQNLAVNGGKSTNSDKNFRAIRRDPNNDHPVILVYEMIGNDVCGKSIEHMTEPDRFKEKTIENFKFFDSVLPAGSHLFILGVADGRILYDSLHDQMHPLNVTYPNLYDYLNCMKTSPCFGWMNEDGSIRNKTTQRANELNEKYREIVREQKFKNFDMAYYDVPLLEMIDRATKLGYSPKDIIEPVDGFHPNQLANMLLSQIMFEKMINDHPDWLGPVNPNNQKIDIMFGKPFKHDHERDHMETLYF